jgi:hypothetical protein
MRTVSLARAQFLSGRVTGKPEVTGSSVGLYRQTLVLYRMRPIIRAPVGSGRRAGRVRYSCLKEAGRREAFMRIQWCWGYEKGLGNRWWS